MKCRSCVSSLGLDYWGTRGLQAGWRFLFMVHGRGSIISASKSVVPPMIYCDHSLPGC